MAEGLTQEQVDAIVRQRVAETKASVEGQVTEKFQGKLTAAEQALNEMKAKFGDLEKTHKTVADEYTGKKSEWEKREKEFGTIEAEHKTLKQKLADREFDDNLVANGIKGEHASDLRILLNSKGLLVDDKGQPKDLKKVLEEVKPKYLPFFATSDNKAAGTKAGGGTDSPQTPPRPGDRIPK